MEDKIKEDIKQENLDQKKIPALSKKINKKVVSLILIIFFILFVYGFIKGSMGTAKNNNNTRLEETQEEKIAEESLDFNTEELIKKSSLKKEKNEEKLITEEKTNKVEEKLDNTLDQKYREQYELEKEKLMNYYMQLIQQEQEARTSKMNFSLNLQQGKQNQNINSGIGNTVNSIQNPLIGNLVQNEYKEQNGQADKKAFLNSQSNTKFYNSYMEMEAIAPYEVKAGSIIPGIIYTGINSELPGNIIGLVRENVYDTVTGSTLLIPQGTKIMGKYDSSVTFGQERVLIVWDRLIFPNGKSIGLDNMPGVDLSGYAGMKDKVNNHYFKLLQAVVLSSFLGAGEAIITRDEYGKDDWRYEAGKGGGEVIIDFGNKMADKILNQQPTLEIRPAQKFNIMVVSDLILSPYEE
jgi:type IV secretory pathway VirB10-like protein